MLRSKTVGYSAVATTRSALSSFITVNGIKGGEHPSVSRFMSGLFNEKPAITCYTETWDPQIVLNYLKTFPAVESMSLSQKFLLSMFFLYIDIYFACRSLFLFTKKLLLFMFLCMQIFNRFFSLS